MSNGIAEGIQFLVHFGQGGDLLLQPHVQVLNFSFGFLEGGVIAGELFGLLLNLLGLGIEFHEHLDLGSQHFRDNWSQNVIHCA